MNDVCGSSVPPFRLSDSRSFRPPDRAGSVALARRLLVAWVQPVIEDDRREQHDAAYDVLHLVVYVHDGEGVEQGADEGTADDHADHAAAATDKTYAAEHDHEDHIVDLSAVDD